MPAAAVSAAAGNPIGQARIWKGKPDDSLLTASRSQGLVTKQSNRYRFAMRGARPSEPRQGPLAPGPHSEVSKGPLHSKEAANPKRLFAHGHKFDLWCGCPVSRTRAAADDPYSDPYRKLAMNSTIAYAAARTIGHGRLDTDDWTAAI